MLAEVVVKPALVWEEENLGVEPPTGSETNVSHYVTYMMGLATPEPDKLD